MLQALVNQFYTMPLGEELHTIFFTAFLVGGALCCFRRSGAPRGLETAERPLEPAICEPHRREHQRPPRIRRMIAARARPPHSLARPPQQFQRRAIA
jgi:hypothetical protein